MEPQTITDQGIALLNGGVSSPTGSASNPITSDSGSVVPTTHIDQKFPPVLIARETIAQSLNTETKRITGEYSFESLGAFAVYSSTHPLANIKISGDGIVATDANGNTTFALDGETGDATFKGTVQAADFTVIDENGIVSLSAFQNGSGQYTNTADLSISQVGASWGAWTDIDSSLQATFTLSQTTNVYIFFVGIGGVSGASGVILTEVRVVIDGVQSGGIGVFDATTTVGSQTGNINMSLSQIVQIVAGSHTIKMQWRAYNGTGGISGRTSLGLDSGQPAAEIGYITLGR